MIKVNIIIDYQPWKLKLKNPNLYLKKRLEKILKRKILKNNSQEFSIMLTNKIMMKKLIYKFRKKKKPTDVLAFPFSTDRLKQKYIGDIAVCYEIINQRSKKSNFRYEFDKMWIHGYLHLIGYKHKRNIDYKLMLNKEQKIIKQFDYKF